MAIEAAAWREELAQKRDVRLAWHIAALQRTKRLPALRSLMQPAKARKLTGEELERRRREHAELMERAHGR